MIQTLIKSLHQELSFVEPQKPTINRAEILAQCGFIKHPEVINQKEKQFQYIPEILKFKKLIEDTYPGYIWISKEHMENLCTRYNIVIDNPAKFVGDIPTKNLLEIQKGLSIYGLMGRIHISGSGHVDIKNKLVIVAPKHMFEEDVIVNDDPIAAIELNEYLKCWECNNQKEYTINHVICGGYKGYLILSKWGLESNDQSIINPQHN